jgi:hypothetical protein
MRKNNFHLALSAGLAPRSLPILMIMVMVLIGCSGQHKPEKPKDLIPEDTYIDLLVEMQNIQSYRNADPDSVNADSLKNLVLNHYSVSDSQFLATHKYYQMQPDRHLEQIDSVISRLDKEELRIRAFIDSVQTTRQKKDSVDTPGEVES